MTDQDINSPNEHNKLNLYARRMNEQWSHHAAFNGEPIEQVVLTSCNENLMELGQSPEMTWIDLNINGNTVKNSKRVDAWGVDEHERLHLTSVLMGEAVNEEQLPYVLARKELTDTLEKMANMAGFFKGQHTLEQETQYQVKEFANRARQIMGTKSPEVALHIITPCQYKGAIPQIYIENTMVTVYVHDISRMVHMSGDRPNVQTDFRSLEGGGLPCLIGSLNDDNEPYVLLTVFPGEMLADMYDRRRDELMRSNVRIYLRQTRSVNKDMANSVKTRPKQFIALNNGISGVASGLQLNKDGSRIEILDDFQIVNGGQTTATLHELSRKARGQIDLSQVSVQAKITIIPQGTEGAEQLTKAIALASNSQTKITKSDLVSGDADEIALEGFSRSKRYSCMNSQTGWFYERTRGQYGLLDQRAKDIYPKDQVITKSYAAQLMFAWNKKPHLASRGAEKALVEYKKELQTARANGTLPEVSTEDFDKLVALAIIRREAEGPIAEQGRMKPPLGWYLIAWLSEYFSDNINLAQIARTGVLSQELIALIQKVTPMIFEVISTKPAEVAHESERPKHERCWQAVKEIQYAVKENELREFTRQDWAAAQQWITTKRNAPLKLKITRAISLINRGKAKSEKQFLQQIMQEAIDAGFKIDLSKVTL